MFASRNQRFILSWRLHLCAYMCIIILYYNIVSLYMYNYLHCLREYNCIIALILLLQFNIWAIFWRERNCILWSNHKKKKKKEKRKLHQAKVRHVRGSPRTRNVVCLNALQICRQLQTQYFQNVFILLVQNGKKKQ